MYAGYLSQCWQEGCHNAAQLWRELRDQGFSGSDTRVHQWMRQHHRPNIKVIAFLQTVTQPIPSPHPITLTDEKTKTWMEELRQRVPDVNRVAQLANEFVALLREKWSGDLPDWLAQAVQSPLVSFVAGLRRDLAAVQAAFSSPWSHGQVEGQVNRLKMLKRQMYGSRQFPALAKSSLSIAKSGAGLNPLRLNPLPPKAPQSPNHFAEITIVVLDSVHGRERTR